MPAFAPDGSDEIASALVALPAGTPVSEVARRLLDLFTSGSVEPGSRLPPERQLATTLGVGRSAVREALAALEILGIVDVRPGSGTYLRGTASELLPQTLRWGLLIGEHGTEELLELRTGLETYVARLAATRPDARLPEMRRHLDRMRATVGDLGAFAKADRAFHQTLAETAGNTVINDLLHVVRSLLQVYADRAVHDEDAARAAIEEHAAVLDAVERGDADAAASAMSRHMATAAARIGTAG
jgi:GntR family transcriptional regulator, transcriptional repressor for pyruvate dehydrogenase complex